MKTILCDLCAKNNLCRKKYLKKDKCFFFGALIGNHEHILSSKTTSTPTLTSNPIFKSISFTEKPISCPKCGNSNLKYAYNERYKCRDCGNIFT